MARLIKYPKLILAVTARPVRPDSYFTGFTVQVRQVEPLTEDGLDVVGLDGRAVAGIKITCETTTEKLANPEDPMGGVDVEWDAYNYSLGELQTGVKALTQLRDKLAKIDDEYGPPASFGAYVSRVGKVLGIGQIRVVRPDYPQQINLPLDDGRRAIDGVIATWRDQVRAFSTQEVS